MNWAGGELGPDTDKQELLWITFDGVFRDALGLTGISDKPTDSLCAG